MQFKEILYNLLRDLRRLEYFVEQEVFDSTYESGDSNTKSMIEQLVTGGMCEDPQIRMKCINDLRDFLKHCQGGDITIRSLRDRAQVLGIKGWSRLPKEVLLIKIRKIEEQNATRQSDSVSNGLEGATPSARSEADSVGIQQKKTG